MKKEVFDLIQELTSYNIKSRNSFPRADVRKITGGNIDDELNFVGDLNTYDMTISGPISWGMKIAEWPRGKIEKTLEYSSKSFFDHYSNYRFLETSITKSYTPELYADMQLHEEIRTTLRKLLAQLLAEKHG